MDLERDGNMIEAGVWFVLSLGMLLHLFRADSTVRPTLAVLAETLAVFGGSDLVEAHTGAWWRPWWLFVWKGVCVMVLLIGFMRYYRIQNRNRVQTAINADKNLR